MKSRRFWPVIIILVLAAIVLAGYRMSRNTAAPSPTSSTTPEDAAATTTDVVSNETPAEILAASIPYPTATTTPGDSWKKFTSKGGGYAFEYPSDLISSLDGQGALTLIVPKNTYFHWPLLDDVTMKVTSGLSCPALLADPAGEATTTFTLNGIDWTRTVGDGVGAGNRYREVAYDTISGGTCYHIGFLDHGTNGAGFYVDDASLIKKYDAVHDADFARVIGVLNGMVASFRILAASR